MASSVVRRTTSEDILLPPKIIRLPKVEELTALSRSTIYQKIREGTFPANISLGARAVGWLESDVVSWLEQQIQNSRKAA